MTPLQIRAAAMDSRVGPPSAGPPSLETAYSASKGRVRIPPGRLQKLIYGAPPGGPGMGEGRALKLLVWLGLATLIVSVLVSLVDRAVTDWANLSSGTVPPAGDLARGYALNPILACAHIIPGAVFLLGAPLQLSSAFVQATYVSIAGSGRSSSLQA